MTRLPAQLHLLTLYVGDRVRRLVASRDRGSETTEKVLWIALVVGLVLATYAIFQTKIIAKITSLEL